MRSEDPAISPTFLAFQLLFRVIEAAETGKAIWRHYFSKTFGSEIFNTWVAILSFSSLHRYYKLIKSIVELLLRRPLVLWPLFNRLVWVIWVSRVTYVLHFFIFLRILFGSLGLFKFWCSFGSFFPATFKFVIILNFLLILIILTFLILLFGYNFCLEHILSFFQQLHIPFFPLKADFLGLQIIFKFANCLLITQRKFFLPS